jgi:hypothetical protein
MWINSPGGVGQGTQLALVIALLVLIFIVFLLIDTLKRQRRRSRFPYRLFRFDQQKPDLTDVGQQLRAVMAGSFEKQRVLSSGEYRIFAIIEGEIAAQRAGYRVFAQTSLGEILKSSNHDAFQSINSKRVDILVVDRWGWPFLAVEYQGDGHYQGTAAARDAVKKEALRKAGVKYIEFGATDTDDQIRTRLREHLTSKVAAPTKVR